MALRDIILADAGLKSFWEGNDALGSGTLVDQKSAHNATLNAAGSKTGMPGADYALATAWRSGTSDAAGGGTVTNHADFNSTTLSFETCFRALQHMRGIRFNFWDKGSDWFSIQLASVGATLVPRVKTWAGTIVDGTIAISDTRTDHHIVFTCAGAYNTIKIYVDGVECHGSYTSRTLTPNASNAAIGSDYQPGLMHHTAYYSTVLDQAAVTARYNAFLAERDATKGSVSFGIHTDSIYKDTADKIDSDIASVAAIKGKVARSTLRMSVAEPTEGNYNWTLHDEFVRICNAYGITPWFVFAGSPTWANGGADDWHIPGTGVDATYLTWLGKLQTFITAFVHRYKPGGVGPQTIVDPFYVEVWNEPNLSGFWSGAPNADQYARLYKDIRASILAEYASARVVFAGLSSWSAAGAPDITGETFFRAVLASAQWSASPIDYMAYHNYDGANGTDSVTAFNNHFNDVLPLRCVLAELGYGAAPICLTELGFADATSQADQAAKLTTAFNRIKDEWSRFVPIVVWWSLDDTLGGGNDYGLFTSIPTDGTPSAALKTAATTFKGFGPTGGGRTMLGVG